MFGQGGHSLRTERIHKEVKHPPAWLGVGFLLPLAVACSLRKNNISINSKPSGSARITNANRPANADVYIDKFFMARDNGGQPGESAGSFAPGDRTVWCVIQLNQPKANTAVKFVWKAIDGEGAQNKYAYNGKDSMTFEYTTLPDIKSVFSHVTYADDWPTGSYRVEVYINGTLDKTIDYTIE
jgi:hypothetical protein